jgi:hypothetical protein
MTRAFADTVYWVARINPRDQWHATFKAVGRLRLVTSDVAKVGFRKRRQGDGEVKQTIVSFTAASRQEEPG